MLEKLQPVLPCITQNCPHRGNIKEDRKKVIVKLEKVSPLKIQKLFYQGVDVGKAKQKIKSNL